jgi:hypothetical protein
MHGVTVKRNWFIVFPMAPFPLLILKTSEGEIVVWMIFAVKT